MCYSGWLQLVNRSAIWVCFRRVLLFTKVTVDLCQELRINPLVQFLFVPGPAEWKGICKSGKKQSPIDIKGATYDSNLGEFTLINYNKISVTDDFKAENDGHGFKVSFPEKKYNVSGGDLSGTYTTVQFHIHWGADNSKGSEHTVNGKQYAAEVLIYLFMCFSVWVAKWSRWTVGDSLTTCLHRGHGNLARGLMPHYRGEAPRMIFSTIESKPF